MMDIGHVQFPQEPPTLVIHSQERRIKSFSIWSNQRKESEIKSKLKLLKSDYKAVEFCYVL